MINNFFFFFVAATTSSSFENDIKKFLERPEAIIGTTFMVTAPSKEMLNQYQTHVVSKLRDLLTQAQGTLGLDLLITLELWGEILTSNEMMLASQFLLNSLKSHNYKSTLPLEKKYKKFILFFTRSDLSDEIVDSLLIICDFLKKGKTEPKNEFMRQLAKTIFFAVEHRLHPKLGTILKLMLYQSKHFPDELHLLITTHLRKQQPSVWLAVVLPIAMERYLKNVIEKAHHKEFPRINGLCLSIFDPS